MLNKAYPNTSAARQLQNHVNSHISSEIVPKIWNDIRLNLYSSSSPFDDILTVSLRNKLNHA